MSLKRYGQAFPENGEGFFNNKTELKDLKVCRFHYEATQQHRAGGWPGQGAFGEPTG
jgi:hypothetical protein